MSRDVLLWDDFFAGGIHDYAKPSVTVAPTTPEPRIENDGNGWFTVHGHEHGPVQRYGRVNAESTLAAIVAGRFERNDFVRDDDHEYPFGIGDPAIDPNARLRPKRGPRPPAGGGR